MDYANPISLIVRRIGQQVGVLRPALRLYRKLFSAGYEDVFASALVDEIKAGDVVWDVGANEGLYTRKFAEIVGLSGKVIAFEPSPRALPMLIATVASLPQAEVHSVALSDRDGVADFLSSTTTQTDSLAINAKTGEIARVTIARGDNFASEICPNIIKIDVEGFELEVVRGLTNTLASQAFRSVFIEVHFLEMEKRGLRDGVRVLKKELEHAGLVIRWLDPSHLVARRSVK